MHKISMNVYSFLCKMTGRPGFGRMQQGWKRLVLLEKITKGFSRANSYRWSAGGRAKRKGGL
jgi:hypothetical protein